MDLSTWIRQLLPLSPDCRWRERLVEADDHNGSIFYQHERFARILRGEQSVEVTLQDGLKAVLMGLAAHRSIETGEAINLT